jgi:ankyrin repeat protein
MSVLLLLLQAAGVDPDGTTALHWAAYHDRIDEVRVLLGKGAKADVANRFGSTPLSLACRNGNEAMVALLLEAGADPNAGAEPPLLTASRHGRPGVLKALLAKGAKVDSNALMAAAAEGHADAVGLLLDAGAKPKSGFGPLHVAARNGRLDAVRVLLKAGADPKAAVESPSGGRGSMRKGTSALILAVENGHFELALALVDAGADPNDVRCGYSPLHAVSWVRKPHRGDEDDGAPPPDGSGKVDSLAFVRELVKRGADVNLALKKGDPSNGKLSADGATPLLYAARRADLPLIQVLVELGADFRPNADRSTPLMAAAGLGTQQTPQEAGTEEEVLETLAWLLQKGADINAVDRDGETAMHGAAYKNFPKAVTFLAERGAKIEVWNRKNRQGRTPIMIAEGFRPGNFKPSPETVAALHAVLKDAGVPIPPPTPRPDPASQKKGY